MVVRRERRAEAGRVVDADQHERSAHADAEPDHVVPLPRLQDVRGHDDHGDRHDVARDGGGPGEHAGPDEQASRPLAVPREVGAVPGREHHDRGDVVLVQHRRVREERALIGRSTL